MSEAFRLRVIIAAADGPTRASLSSTMRSYDDVEVVGEASDGARAVGLIEYASPNLALLDLQMPEIDGLGVVRLLHRNRIPLIAFVTAPDELAVRVFEANGVDYVLKPVEPARLRQVVNRAIARLDRHALGESDAERVRLAAAQYAAHAPAAFLRRIAVRKLHDIVIVPVDQIESIVAEGELLRVTTHANDRYTIIYGLKELETRLDPVQFVRISHWTIVSIPSIMKITQQSDDSYQVLLRGGACHRVPRLRGRVIRDQLSLGGHG